MITLKIDNKLYEVPSSFEEVNPKLFEKIARLIYASKSNYTMKKKVFELLVKLPTKITKHITSEQWYELFKLIDFLFEATELNKIEKFVIGPTTYFFSKFFDGIQ